MLRTTDRVEPLDHTFQPSLLFTGSSLGTQSVITKDGEHYHSCSETASEVFEPSCGDKLQESQLRKPNPMLAPDYYATRLYLTNYFKGNHKGKKL